MEQAFTTTSSGDSYMLTEPRSPRPRKAREPRWVVIDRGRRHQVNRSEETAVLEYDGGCLVRLTTERKVGGQHFFSETVVPVPCGSLAAFGVGE